MKPRQQVTRAAIELIKRFEGCRSQAAQLPDGRWTIGHGHTLTARQGAEVSAEDAEALLLYDLIAISFSMNEWVYAPLSQNQFDALCAFAFNIGLDDFRRSSVLKRVNEGALLQAAYGMELWRKADFEGEQIVVDALVRRRAAEKALFLTPPQGAWIPAPSPALRPRYDADGEALIPAAPPTELLTAQDGEQITVQRAASPEAAPDAAEKPPSPIQAAAEVVTARLQTLFQGSADPAAAEPVVDQAVEEPTAAGPMDDVLEPAEAPEEPPPAPAQVFFPGPALGIPQRKIEPPAAEALPVEPLEHVEASPPPELTEPEAVELADVAEPVEPMEMELLDQPEQEPEPEPEPESEAEAAVLPNPFADESPSDPKTDLLTTVVLAFLGLAFFAGGLFWALNAHPGPQTRVVDPLLVGWLAGAAGVGFMAIAVYMMLDSLGRAAQRPEKRNSRVH